MINIHGTFVETEVNDIQVIQSAVVSYVNGIVGQRKSVISKDYGLPLHYLVQEKNAKEEPLVDPQIVILPTLHIMLGLTKVFVKQTKKKEQGFQYLRKNFQYMTDAKLKEGVFIGPQIEKLIKKYRF